ncbi:hypothetical protein F511_19310 [Dorcoceras hygrometricum]|uniref:Uncharacterized protein n=1 Tax=Dorcoceras hygrometricum TaxID=472368 RepID=A0A2Z7AX81_9LAMI|nr:hypothetical protein F511_19310 [Dorcoceras hygrometricum]
MAACRRAIMRRALGKLRNQCASRPASLANQQPSCIDELRATMGVALRNTCASGGRSTRAPSRTAEAIITRQAREEGRRLPAAPCAIICIAGRATKGQASCCHARPARMDVARAAGGKGAAACGGIQLAVGPQPLRLRNHNSGLAQRIMVKRLATSPHDPLGITDSACKNPVGRDSIGYPRMSASGESSTTMHRLLHESGSHPIPTPYDPKRVGKRVKLRRLSCRVSMTFRVVRTNQYNQDLGLIHSTNGNHLESPNEGSLIDHQVTIYLHAQNITMFPTNET